MMTCFYRLYYGIVRVISKSNSIGIVRVESVTWSAQRTRAVLLS
jgi:hypothetical protein